MNVPQLYGPDGVPLDGPRTTAAEMAATLGHIGVQPGAPLFGMFRAAAHYEGERYAEAIRGAREMRQRDPASLDQEGISADRREGIPFGWITR